jgi:cytosine deaminase
MDCLKTPAGSPLPSTAVAAIHTILSPLHDVQHSDSTHGITKVVIGENKTSQGPESHLRTQGHELDIRKNLESVALM